MHARFPARSSLMHLVKSRRAIGRAFHDYGVKTFALDSEDELDKILAETNQAKDLTLIVRFAVSGDAPPIRLRASSASRPRKRWRCCAKPARSAKRCWRLLPCRLAVHASDAYRSAMDMVNRAIVEAGVLVDIVDVGGGFPAIYISSMTLPPMIEYLNTIKDGFEQMYVAQNAKLWPRAPRAGGRSRLHRRARRAAQGGRALPERRRLRHTVRRHAP
ncbi:MAG: hypothetical protein R3C16_05915 [Hyphomonadaceae bacterium]